MSLVIITGTTKQWSWADESQPSVKTPGKQHTCSRGCRWLSNGEIRSPSTALSPASKCRCGLTCLVFNISSSGIEYWGAKNNNNNINNNRSVHRHESRHTELLYLLVTMIQVSQYNTYKHSQSACMGQCYNGLLVFVEPTWFTVSALVSDDVTGCSAGLTSGCVCCWWLDVVWTTGVDSFDDEVSPSLSCAPWSPLSVMLGQADADDAAFNRSFSAFTASTLQHRHNCNQLQSLTSNPSHYISLQSMMSHITMPSLV